MMQSFILRRRLQAGIGIVGVALQRRAYVVLHSKTVLHKLLHCLLHYQWICSVGDHTFGHAACCRAGCQASCCTDRFAWPLTRAPQLHYNGEYNEKASSLEYKYENTSSERQFWFRTRPRQLYRRVVTHAGHMNIPKIRKGQLNSCLQSQACCAASRTGHLGWPRTPVMHRRPPNAGSEAEPCAQLATRLA